MTLPTRKPDVPLDDIPSPRPKNRRPTPTVLLIGLILIFISIGWLAGPLLLADTGFIWAQPVTISAPFDKKEVPESAVHADPGASAQKPVPAPAASFPATQKNSTAQSVQTIVNVWKRVARNEKIPPQFIQTASAKLRDILTNARPNPPADLELKAYALSLTRFIQSNAWMLANPNHKGFSRESNWLAYCTARAFTRPASNSARQRAVIADYQTFSRQITDQIRANIKLKIPPEQYALWKPVMDDAIANFEKKLNAWIKIMNQDFLFPAFKEPLTAKSKKRLLAHFSNPGSYPSYPNYKKNKLNPTTVPSLDQWYHDQLQGFFENGLTNEMCWMSIEQLSKQVILNPYLGYTLCYFTNAPGIWPCYVQLTPDEYTNKKKNGSR